MSKSRPLYAPFRLDLTGRAHLIVTDRQAPPEGVEDSLSEIEVWTIHTAAPGVAAPAIGNVRPFRAVAELLSTLGPKLSRAPAGLRLYAIGSEAFVWDAWNIARGAGLGQLEISVHRAGPLVRRVFCIHCRTVTENVDSNIVSCPGCGAALFVRDHFSRRLAAFIGVKVDAEVPGDIPVAERFTS